MPRIVGVDIPNEKRIEASLQYIYGVGPSRAKVICEKAQVSPDTRANTLTEEQLKQIAQAVQSFVIEGDLRREQQTNIKRMISINCYRGLRHRRGLPVRGQRTRTNARTRKGPKKLPGSKKK
mgnify:CR=1